MNYLLTVSGDDQKGLVEALAATIESMGGNWLESRLCRLGGQFAGIVTIEFADQPSEFPANVGTLNCLWKQVTRLDDRPSESYEARIKILAADRPGIVKQIAHLLTRGGANVEEVESRVSSAPFSGEQMFEADYRICLERSANKEELRKSLESLAEELMCEVSFLES